MSQMFPRPCVSIIKNLPAGTRAGSCHETGWRSAGKTASGFLLVALLILSGGCGPPGPRALLKGRELVERGKYQEAVQQLKVATSLLPTNALAWDYLGLAYHHAGDGTEAEKAYQRALLCNRDLV